MQNITDRKQAGTTASGHLRDPCNDNMSCLRSIPYGFSGSTFKHSVFFSERRKELLHMHKVSFVTQKYLGKAYHLYICDLVGIISILSPWPPSPSPNFYQNFLTRRRALLEITYSINEDFSSSFFRVSWISNLI